jgi:hypothetical protein
MSSLPADFSEGSAPSKACFDPIPISLKKLIYELKTPSIKVPVHTRGGSASSLCCAYLLFNSESVT